MKSRYTLTIATLGIALAAGYAAPKSASAQNTAPVIQMDGVRIPEGKAIAHQPFAKIDGRTRRAYKPGEMITLPDGKKVNADLYFREINALEKSMNVKGQSLRNEATSSMSDAAPAQQVTPLEIPTKATEKYESAHPAGMVSSDFGSSNLNIGTQRYNWGRNFGWTAGNNGSAGVYISGGVSGRAQLRGPRSPASDVTGVFVGGNAQFGAYLFNHRVPLARLDASLDVPLQGNVDARLTASVFGYDISNWRRVQHAVQFGNSISRGASSNIVDLRAMLGPIPVRATVGVSLNGGLSYGLNLHDGRASGNLTPWVNSTVWARAGADIVVAGIGVGGELTLLNESTPLITNAALAQASNGRYYVGYGYQAGETTNILRGRVYVYAYIYVPRFGIPPWRRAEWDWTLLNWGGFSRSTTFFSASNSLWFS